MVDEFEELRLHVLRRRWGESRSGVAIAAAGEAAEIVRQQVGGDVLDRPAGTDSRLLPFGRREGSEEFKQRGPLFGEEVEGEDGFEGLHE